MIEYNTGRYIYGMYGRLYKITNSYNDSVYIGKTYNTLETRFHRHIESMCDENKKNRPLYRQMRKYGYINHKIELIGIYRDGLLEEKEMECIDKMRKAGKTLLNLSSGGDGSMLIDKANENKVLLLYVLNHKSIGYIAKLLNLSVNTVKKTLENNYIFTDNIDKYRPNPAKKKIIGTKVSVKMIDKEKHRVLRVFNSIRDAGNFLHIDDPSHISKVCRGKRKTAYGYTWQYV